VIRGGFSQSNNESRQIERARTFVYCYILKLLLSKQNTRLEFQLSCIVWRTKKI